VISTLLMVPLTAFFGMIIRASARLSPGAFVSSSQVDDLDRADLGGRRAVRATTYAIR
jgi:hypothetical protein